MLLQSLAELESAIRASWSAATADPDPNDQFRGPDNPSRGQCIVTALVVQDFLGGELLEGKVFVGDVQEGYHTWNKLPSGVELDLTREQFLTTEVVTPGVVVPRITGPDMRLAEQYAILRAAVDEHLRRRVQS